MHSMENSAYLVANEKLNSEVQNWVGHCGFIIIFNVELMSDNADAGLQRDRQKWAPLFPCLYNL